MRVITGEAKGHKLKGPPDITTRPMQDKIREGLFSALEALDLDVSRVLDLYSGTGAIGIEAISRGADWADLVDRGKAQCAVIKWNLEHTKLSNRARVHQMPVGSFLAHAREPYDLIFLDPPYADPDIHQTLRQIATSPLVESRTIIALGHWPRFDAAAVEPPLVLIRNRCHGDSCFSIFEINEDQGEGE